MNALAQAGLTYIQQFRPDAFSSGVPDGAEAHLEAIGRDLQDDQLINADGREAFRQVAGLLGRQHATVPESINADTARGLLAEPAERDQSDSWFDKIINFFKEKPALGFGGIGALLGLIAGGPLGMLIGGGLGALGGFAAGKLFPQTFGGEQSAPPPQTRPQVA
jgi:hypothetical protein